jgi:hypothetical protein
LGVQTTPESVGTTGEQEDLATKKVLSNVEASHDQSTTGIPIILPETTAQPKSSTQEIQQTTQESLISGQSEASTLPSEIEQTTIESGTTSGQTVESAQSTQTPIVSEVTEHVPLLQGEDRKLATGEQAETTTPQNIVVSSVPPQLVTGEAQETTVGEVIEATTQPKEQIGSGFVTESQINEPASTGVPIEEGSTPGSVVERRLNV